MNQPPTTEQLLLPKVLRLLARVYPELPEADRRQTALETIGQSCWRLDPMGTLHRQHAAKLVNLGLGALVEPDRIERTEQKAAFNRALSGDTDLEVLTEGERVPIEPGDDLGTRLEKTTGKKLHEIL